MKRKLEGLGSEEVCRRASEDPAAFEELCVRFFEPISNFAMKKLRSTIDPVERRKIADDLTHDVLMVVVRRGSSGEPIRNVKAFLHKVARYAVYKAGMEIQQLSDHERPLDLQSNEPSDP